MYEEAARFLYDNYISGSKKLKGLRRASVLATILNAYINGVDKDKLIRFCKVMCTGIAINAEEDNYIIRFRNHILESKYNGGNTPIKELYFITQTVLHNYLIGKYKKRITNDNKAYYVFTIDTNTINEEKLSHLTLLGKKSK